MAGAIICFILCALLLWMGRYLVTPVRSQRQAKLFAVIKVSGDAEGLEQLCRGMEYLKRTGTMETDIVIAADGLSDEGRRRVELTAERRNAAVCSVDDIAEVLTHRSGR